MNRHGAIIAVALVLAAFLVPAFADCEDGHWIKSVSSEILEDTDFPESALSFLHHQN
jgi:hypothetical protein